MHLRNFGLLLQKLRYWCVAASKGPIKQVRITAQVLELTGNLADELGINWGVANNSTNINAANTNDSTLLSASGGVFGSAGGILNLATTLSSAGDIISAAIDLLRTTQDAEVSSRPAVITLNGETADLNVTSERYIGDKETTDDDGNTTTEPVYKEAGTKLKVKATVRDGGNEKDTIILEITSEVSSFLEITNANGAIQKNIVTNKVSVLDGGTIFIGGLKRSDIIKNSSKIPFLGDIPVFGRLFRSDSLTRDIKDLVIQIKAEIVTDENMNNDISAEGFKKSTTDLPKSLFGNTK